MPTPLVRALKFARTPAGRKVLKEAVRIARSEEGRKLIAQARKVASSPEGKRLLEHAKHLVKAPSEAAHEVEQSKGWQALRERFNSGKPKP
jgi:DNA-binding PadR family transcriptional regulator